MERFEATLAASGSSGGRWVELPFDAREAFGQARAPVAGTVNGTAFRGRVSVYGGRYYLGLNREVREAAGIEVGDRLSIELERDEAPRDVEVPVELEAAFAGAPDARERYERLSFTHRREYARWVGEAKRAETRTARAEKSVAMLRDGITNP